MKNQQKPEAKKPERLIENIDFYFENDLMVFTRYFLEKRGFCCRNDCRHCPYPKAQNKKL